MSELLDQFATLFAGNTGAVGGNEGRAIKYVENPRPRGMETRTDRWWKLKLEGHLDGSGEPIGVYPLVAAAADAPASESEHPLVTKWGCIDWDQGYEESWPDALNTHNILRAFDITSWIERSRSKGWHLWVFADQWIPAETMRNALMAACQLVGAPTKEVNPKQTTLKPGGLGNYVRLPYPGAFQKYDEYAGGIHSISQHIVDPGNPEQWYRPFNWATRALANRCTIDQLQKLATRAQTTQPQRDVDAPTHEMAVSSETTRKLDGLTWTLLKDGPLPDRVTGDIDRSAGLWRLAVLMREQGAVTPAEAWAVMCDADRRWGRYLEEDRPELLRQTLTKAWSQ